MEITELVLMIVGYTEIFKNLFVSDKNFLKFLMSVLVGAVVITIYCLCGDNQKLMSGLTAFATATLGYDTIVKRLKNGKGNNDHTIGSDIDDLDIGNKIARFADPEEDDDYAK